LLPAAKAIAAGIPPTPNPSPHHAEGVSSTRRGGGPSSARPAGHDLGKLRPLAVGLLLLGRADVDEAGRALVGGEAQGCAHALAVGIPLRDPAGAEAQRVGGKTHVEAGGAAGEDLLPFG